MDDAKRTYMRPLLFGMFAAAGVAAGILAALFVDPESREKILTAMESLAETSEQAVKT